MSAIETPAVPLNGAGTLVEQAKAATLPIGTVDAILANAPSDLVEEIVEVPEWGCSVKIRSSTAADQAAIKQAGIVLSGQSPDVAWGNMEKAQFLAGVLEPRFSEQQVDQLHKTSGRGFARVISALDRINGTEKEELANARREFRDGE